MDADMEFVERVFLQLSAHFHLMIKCAYAGQFAFGRAGSEMLVEVFNVLVQHILVCPLASCKVQKLPKVDTVSLYRIW